jgi:RimJ/RimL family protein N-acetyltransferase
MLQNQNLVLKHPQLNLVPYRKEHVLQYHEWMKDAELLELTASEPLSLEEEYSMQQSWRDDEKKCTFIVQSPLFEQNVFYGLGGMIGDVNLYFNDHDDLFAVEIEIMIAEKEMRRKGLGRIATLMMMSYAIRELKVKKFTAKISIHNDASIKLFHQLGYVEVSKSEVFQEITLERIVDVSTQSITDQIEYRSDFLE